MKEGKCDAFFSGTWKADAAKEALGENYAAAQLPTITINGEAKQLRAFAGSKCIGVNPNCKNQKAALQLALFLGSKDAQLAHYTMGNIAPCHPELAADPTIAADVAVAALINSIANSSVLQPTIAEMGNYWTPAGNMASEIINGTVTHENAAEKTAAFVDAINGKGGL
jgi:arabinogalactan oligomer/maltooligosaccharide transport system substrate-binding protein